MTSAIYKALHFDVSLEVLAKHAHQFKILQDQFRQAASATALSGFDEIKAEFRKLMDQMDRGARELANRTQAVLSQGTEKNCRRALRLYDRRPEVGSLERGA